MGGKRRNESEEKNLTARSFFLCVRESHATQSAAADQPNYLSLSRVGHNVGQRGWCVTQCASFDKRERRCGSPACLDPSVRSGGGHRPLSKTLGRVVSKHPLLAH